MVIKNILVLFIFLAELSLADQSNVNKSEPKFRSIIGNFSFEEGQGDTADDWAFTSRQPPIRAGSDAHTGSHSAYINLQNEGKTPSEAHIIKTIDGKLIGGLNYELSFFVKQIKPGTGGYIQQYVVEWWDEGQQVVKGTGFKQFSSKIGEWEEIVVPDLDIPENVRSVKLLFRFVTGAIEGGGGEAFIDDIKFIADDSSEALVVSIERKVELAQFVVALSLIDSFLLKYPNDPKVDEIKSLRGRVNKFQQLEDSSE
ncbi:MAG: hypothetical protein HN584_07250 [Akkermansiaceae bacterium]|jgi:hypothetical protein|nr:hypothetical protein [Akkermansiaceae bacterium]